MVTIPPSRHRLMNFFDVGGRLVRRTKRVRRSETAEVWEGDGWHPYPDLNTLLRHGQRLTEAEALILLQRIRQRHATLPLWSSDEARHALRAPRRGT